MTQTKRTAMENERAAYAYDTVIRHVGSGEYKSYVKRLPSLIQVNGLGQTLAFCKQKKKDYEAISRELHGWLAKTRPDLIKEEGDFVRQVVSLSSPEYRMVTKEVLALLNWMRKFADGLIEKESSDTP